MKLSKHFTLEEMIYSDTANKHSINNLPTTGEIIALRELVIRLLQPLRIAYGKPIYISSGYRCPELNKLVGGVPSSQHVKGEAADCVVDGSASDLLDILQVTALPFDQAILYRKQNFLHLSLRPFKNRRKIIVND